MNLLDKSEDSAMMGFICFPFLLLVNLSKEFSKYSLNSSLQEPKDDFLYLKALRITTEVVHEPINKIQTILKIPLFL